MIQIMEIQTLLNMIMEIQEQINDLPTSILNPYMDN